MNLPRDEASSFRQVEDLIGFEDGMLSNRHRVTADDGSFELSGLLPRTYRVWAVHPATLEIIDPGPVEAGSSAVVLAFTENGAQRVAGRVVSLSGDPIPGIRLFFGRHGSSGDTPFFAPLMTDLAPASDEDGRFEFEGLFTPGAYLIPVGPETSMSDRLYLDQFGDLESLVIRLPRRCLVQILLEQDPDEADRFRIEDGDGNVLSLMVETGNTTLSTNGGLGLAGGRSDVITTDERARTLVLFKDGEEVRRISLQLEPGDVRILRY